MVVFASTSTVESIGEYAFADNSLFTLSIPASVTHIGYGAFEGNKIVAVQLGSGVIIDANSSFGDYGKDFRAYYLGKAKAAGDYVYTNGVWRGPL
jgi:hypothetical protein